MSSYAIQCGSTPLIHHLMGIYFTVLLEHSFVLQAIDSQGASHQNDTGSLDCDGAFARQTLLQPGIVYLGSGGWGLVEG